MFIKVKNIRKSFKKKQVLSNVDFSLKKGEIVGLLGPNGAGKTTLIKLLSHINSPSSGSVEYDDTAIISVVFDFNGLYENFNAVENLNVFNVDNSNGKIEDVLKTVDLWEHRRKKVCSFSKGMKRKLTIARALLTNPNVLILDEPFDGLDVEGRNYWINFLTEWVKNNRSIIISSHIMSDIEELCNRIVVLKEGKVICDSNTESLRGKTSNSLIFNLYEETNKSMLELMSYQYNYTLLSEKKIKFNRIYKDDEQQLIRFFIDKGIAIKEICCEYSSLTDIYLNLIGDSTDE